MSGTTGTARPESFFLNTWFAGGQPSGAIGSQALRDLAVTVVPTGTTMTSGSSITMSTNVLLVNKATGSATAVTLPSAPVPFAQFYTVKDLKGDAAINPITITPASGTIDGAAAFVINVNRMSVTFGYDGTNWSVTSTAIDFILAYSGVGGGGPAIAFAPAGHTFGRQISAAPATLAAYFGSTAAANAFFGSSVASSLTNYADRCVVQAALNACTAGGGGSVLLPLGSIYLDTTITWDSTVTSLCGTSGSLGTKTTLRTETCGSSPALYYAGVIGGLNLNGVCPLRDLDLYAFNAGITSFGATAGVANTGFRSGAIGLQVGNSANGVGARNVGFYNFDTPYKWVTGNVYVLDFIDCYHSSNNYGPNIGTVSTSGVLTNSFEAMRWIGGSHSNNNYGYCFNVPGQNGSIYVTDCSLDYNTVRHGWYNGAGGGNDCTIPLFVSRAHTETDSAHSGTSICRFFNAGNLFLSEVKGDEEGSFPVGWVEPGFYGRTSFVNCLFPGQGRGGIYVPGVFFTGGIVAYAPTGAGNSQRFGGDVMLYQSDNGCTMQGGGSSISSGTSLGTPVQTQTGSYALVLECQPYKQVLASGGGTVTIDAASVANHMIGTIFEFITLDSSAWTLAAAGGVTLTGNTTLGGSAGKRSYVIKTAGNTWLGYT